MSKVTTKFIDLTYIPKVTDLSTAETKTIHGGAGILNAETIEHHINTAEIILKAQFRVAKSFHDYFQPCYVLPLYSLADVRFERPSSNAFYKEKLEYLDDVKARFAANRERVLTYKPFCKKLLEQPEVVKRDFDHMMNLTETMAKRYASIDYTDDDIYKERYAGENHKYDELKKYERKSLYDADESKDMIEWLNETFYWTLRGMDQFDIGTHAIAIYKNPHPISKHYKDLPEEEVLHLITIFRYMPKEYIDDHKKHFIIANLKGHFLNKKDYKPPEPNSICLCRSPNPC